jgi:hypothetical protein
MKAADLLFVLSAARDISGFSLFGDGKEPAT